MALQVPTQAPRRRASHSPSQRPSSLGLPSPSSTQPEDDTTQWVLFAPTARTHTTSTDQTRTVGASRLSDFGSFGTATRSAVEQDGDVVVEDEDALDDHFDEDGTELDSLDDGLHAFRAPSLPSASPSPLDQGPPAMLPAHDGLGSFQASSPMVQDQLWQHEQYNPQRRQAGGQYRRRSSVQRHVDTANEQESLMERDRWQRIEQWRMDQSRAILQEIERETRRRCRPPRSNVSTAPRPEDSPSPTAPLKSSVNAGAPAGAVAEMSESFWQRLTRKVIEDLIGIDDALLSVILGESLPLEVQSEGKESPPLDMETVLAREPDLARPEAPFWQSRVLQRIAHELGILVHQLCEHPGAFTSYYELTKTISSEYAGMPLNRPVDSAATFQSNEPPTAQQSSDHALPTESMPSLHFQPTLGDPHREHAAQWGIEDEDPAGHTTPESVRVQQEQEYWERGLDVMMVFRYLRSRFSRHGYMAGEKHGPTSSPPRHAQDASRRAAIIRQHHPLVAHAHSRSQTQTRRTSYNSGGTTSAGVSAPLTRQHLRRPGSSCASQSKLSAISSRRTLTGSSRNYWDLGGSVDSNSAIGVGAGLGTWAEA